jgi:hypothetical protein
MMLTRNALETNTKKTPPRKIAYDARGTERQAS